MKTKNIGLLTVGVFTVIISDSYNFSNNYSNYGWCCYLAKIGRKGEWENRDPRYEQWGK